mgnify:CR=1 FL=1
MPINYDVFIALGFSAGDSFRLCDSDIGRLRYVAFNKGLIKWTLFY